ncbi:MAG TPA: tetratricopeptide repeat protein [Ignavibacteria bacterium]|nr:tetratricopeptide repeat protein [Ignavibacteria bacterium]
MRSYTLRQKIFFSFIPVLLLIGGCGTWGNFTTYFNRYYNTKTLFEKAEKLILAQKKDLFSTKEFKIPGLARKQLANVIKSASKILQFNSDSKYVDNALLILGKSFYYEKNYQKALRKFEELIATQPNSDLILETRLWIGKAQMKLKQDDQSLATLEAVKQDAIKEEETKIMQDAFIEEIAYRIRQEDYAAAIKSANEFLKISDDDDMNAKVWYELGNLYFDNKDYVNAGNAYLQTIDVASKYKIIYNAQIKLAKSLRNENKLEEAANLLDDMKSKNKNAENFPEIDLEIGLTLLQMNKLQDAKDVLFKVDTLYPRSPFSAIAKYRLGEIYEVNFLNFDSAKVFYQQAQRSALPKEYKYDNNKNVNLFKSYSKLVGGIKMFSKQIEYINNPDEFLKDSAAYYKQKEIERERLLSKQKSITTPINTKLNSTSNTKSKPLLTEKDITNKKAININTKITKNTIPKKIIAPPVRPTLSADSLRSLILNYQFDLGNLYSTEFNLPDSVYKYFSYILKNHPDSKYESQSLFSLGNYYLGVGDTLKADSLFNEIYENHKDKRIVNLAATMLNKPLIVFDYDSTKNIYNIAEKNLEDGKYKEAIPDLYNIYKNYPKSKYAPKALYAAGWVLENKLSLPDSAAEMYSLIKQKYPATIYGKKIFDKVNIYNQEMKRRKRLRDAKIKAELVRKNRELEKQKNKVTSARKNSLSIPIRTLLKKNPNIQRSALLDSLKKLGIILPDSIKRRLLQNERKMKLKKSNVKRDSLLIER